MGKKYIGYRMFEKDKNGRLIARRGHVRVEGDDGHQRPLNPHRDFLDHSSTGYEWRFKGPGSAQLAFALAFDATKDRTRALHVYWRLEALIVGKLSHIVWSLTADEVLSMIRGIEDQEFVGELTRPGGDQAED